MAFLWHDGRRIGAGDSHRLRGDESPGDKSTGLPDGPIVHWAVYFANKSAPATPLRFACGYATVDERRLAEPRNTWRTVPAGGSVLMLLTRPGGMTQDAEPIFEIENSSSLAGDYQMAVVGREADERRTGDAGRAALAGGHALVEQLNEVG